jgi:fibronectin-binding autotransporter adhesin
VSLAGGTLRNGALTGAVTSTGDSVTGIAGTASFTANGGTTTLTGSNNYNGTTTINNGATWLGGSANSFSASSATTLATGAILSTGGFNQTIAPLAGSGNVSLGAATLTAGGHNTSTTFSGIMSGATADEDGQYCFAVAL